MLENEIVSEDDANENCEFCEDMWIKSSKITHLHYACTMPKMSHSSVFCGRILLTSWKWCNRSLLPCHTHRKYSMETSLKTNGKNQLIGNFTTTRFKYHSKDIRSKKRKTNGKVSGNSTKTCIYTKRIRSESIKYTNTLPNLRVFINGRRRTKKLFATLYSVGTAYEPNLPFEESALSKPLSLACNGELPQRSL